MINEFLAAFIKITVENKIIFDGHVIVTESCIIFDGHD
jgi:hypothetical protein